MGVVAILQGLLAFRAAGVAFAIGRLASLPVAAAALVIDEASRLPALGSAVLAGELCTGSLALVSLARHRDVSTRIDVSPVPP
jgi:hypothetical protein